MDSVSSLFSFYVSLLLLTFLTCYCASHIDGAQETSNYHVVNVESLLPNDVCSPSKDSDPSKLKVVHRHGPCSPLKPKHKPARGQVLKNDQIRVDWLHSKARKASADKASTSSIAASKITARRGTQFSSSNYIVTLGFGTPQVSQTVIFDTGSDVSWIQCEPCLGGCHPQQEQIFNPTKSSTYLNISCNSPYCSALDLRSCSGPTCVYIVIYGDNSTTAGFLAQDTLTLTSSDVVQNFRFGCGQQNEGLYGRTSGLLGLGREEVSLVMQTSQKYGGVFSYCLPPTDSTPGYLRFGPTNTANVQFTPMLGNSNNPSFYFLQLQFIAVGGQKLAISPTLFSMGGTFIDSGTVITRLPPTAYSALRAAFRSKMTQYPTIPSFLDTCYDFSNYSTLSIPTVVLGYQGAAVNLDVNGIMYVVGYKQACLAFTANRADTDMGVIGNTQQRRFNVVYDLSRKMVGFGPGAC